MNIDLKDDVTVIEKGTTYSLPEYRVVDGKGIETTGDCQIISFVRGSKLKDEEVEKREGTLHEHLLAMMILDLEYKHKLVPSLETELVIQKLKEAQMWLLKRQVERKKLAIEGTYKK